MPKSAVSLLRPAGTGSSCLLRALGLSAILDRRLGIETTPVGCRFGLDTEIGPVVQLSVPSPLSEEEKGASILRMPLAHQGLEKDAHTCCPVLADDELPRVCWRRSQPQPVQVWSGRGPGGRAGPRAAHPAAACDAHVSWVLGAA